MSVQIILAAYDQSFTLTKQFIQEEMKGSLLAQALEEDANATVITMTSSEVTPNVFQAIVDLSQGKYPEKSNPDFIRADRYLNWPILRAFSTTHYDQLDRKEINSSQNQEIFEVALIDNWYLARYLAIRGFDFTYSNQKAIRIAVRVSNVQCVDYILRQQGVNVCVSQNECLETSIENSNIAMTRLLIQNPKVVSTFDHGIALHSALRDSKLPELIREVTAWPEPEKESAQCSNPKCDSAMRWAILYNEETVARNVLRMNKYELTSIHIELCCEYGRGDILKLLLASSKLPDLLEAKTQRYIQMAENRGNYEIARQLQQINT